MRLIIHTIHTIHSHFILYIINVSVNTSLQVKKDIKVKIFDFNAMYGCLCSVKALYYGFMS